MNVDEIFTKRISEEYLGEEILNNQIDLNIIGISGDYLYLAYQNKMGVYDIKSKRLILPFKEGLIKSEINNETNEFYFIRLVNENIKEIKRPFHDLANTEFNYEIYNKFGRELNSNSLKKAYVWRVENYDEEVINYYDKSNNYHRENHKIDHDFCNIYERDYIINKYNKKRYYNDHIYINKKKELNWDIIGSFDHGLAVIIKNNCYGLVNKDCDVVITPDKDIKTINILNEEVVSITNNQNKKALYNINLGYIFNYQDNIDYQEIVVLNKNVFKIKRNDKYKIMIGKNILDYDFNFIYNFSNYIIGEDDNKISFYDLDGNLLIEINSFDYYMGDNYLFYKDNGMLTMFNLKTNNKKILTCNNFYDINGDSVDIKDVDNYSYYYKYNNKNILFKNMMYGIEIHNNKNISAIKWFDDLDKLYTYEELLFKTILDSVNTDQKKIYVKKEF